MCIIAREFDLVIVLGSQLVRDINNNSCNSLINDIIPALHTSIRARAAGTIII